ncbi:serine hydrolase domain-containing protein [Actinokineospora sp. NPDC004072]
MIGPLAAGFFDPEDWRQRLDGLRERHRVPGAQVGVLALGGDAGDADVRVAASGITSLATGVEVTPDTLFQYGSITKVWTTTLVMQLVDDGEITLDTPVVEVLPDFRIADPGHGDAITVRHLLTHTSGITGDLFTDTGDGDECLQRYVDALADAPSTTAPGGPLSYCNAGFVVAGRIVEVLRGMAWDDAVAAHLARPLGLRHVITRTKEAPLFRTAVGHVLDADRAVVPASRWVLPRSTGPAGLITGSAGDLLRFTAMHLRDGDDVLSARSARAMRTPQVDLTGVSTVHKAWGLGWRIAEWTGEGGPVRCVEHGGQTIGQNARLTAFPDLGFAFCVLTNAAGGPALADEVEALIGAELGLTPPRPLVQAGGDLTPLLGVYETAMTRCTLARGDDGQVRLEVVAIDPTPDDGPPDPPRPVRPSGPGRFTVDMGSGPREITHVVDGDAEYLFLNRLFRRVGPSAG